MNEHFFVEPRPTNDGRPTRLGTLVERASNVENIRFGNVLQLAGKFAEDSFSIEAEHVFYQGSSLDLTNCRATMQLFRVFMADPNHACSMEHILKFVYGITYSERLSSRLRKSARLRVIKLVSRARAQARQAFAAVTPFGLDWFVYHHQTRKWKLCAPNHAMIEGGSIN